jgi:hypothetical protein
MGWLQWCKQVDVGEGLAIHTNTPVDLVFGTGVCVCLSDFSTPLYAVSSIERSLLIVKNGIRFLTVDANQARA